MSNTAVVESHALENSRGDFDELSKFMNQSWSENKQQALFYDTAFLESCFQYPGTTKSLTRTIYNGASLVGFVAAFPRTVRLDGQKLRIALITFLTVAPDYKKKGYGVMLWSELVSRVRAAGFDGMVNYCISESDMDKIIVGCCSRLKLPTACVYSVGYFSRLLSPGEICADVSLGEQQGDSGSTVAKFLSAVAPRNTDATLSRLWSEAEAAWQCQDRVGAVTAYSSDPCGTGALTGYVAHVANENKTKCLFIEDVLWAELDETRRQALLRDFLRKGRILGAEMATVPRCGYADLRTFTAAGFFRTRRVVRAYLTIWNGPSPRPDIPSFYLDVL